MTHIISPLWSFITKHKIIVIILCLFAVWGGWVIWDNRARPLGSEMVYLGKVSGKNIFGLHEYYVYYYGTDISPEGMKDYFQAQKWDPGYDTNTAAFQIENNDVFYIEYDESKASEFVSAKKYIVSVVESDYDIAVEHLRKP